MNVLITLMLLVLFLHAAPSQAETRLDNSRWTFEVKAGSFTPALKDWGQHFSKKDMTEYDITMAYRYTRETEIGAGIGTMRATGYTYYQYHGTPSGDMTYTLRPLTIFALMRLSTSDDQWLIPYVGGGLTRMYYWQESSSRETVRGSADGYHVRGGLQLSLDNIDPNAANRMFLDYGIWRTYFFIEGEYTRAVERSTSTDLGGISYRAGLLFLF